MKTITFKGEEDGHSKTTTHGETFIEGVGREFEDDHPIVAKLARHPLFDVMDGSAPTVAKGKGKGDAAI